MNIIFFGAPGVGKGTQAERLAERLGVPHISTGAIFRTAMASGKELGLRAKAYYDEGKLVPDELTTAIAIEALDEPQCSNGFILDGYPRNISQAQALTEALKARARNIDVVVYLTAPEDEIIERMMKRGRADDTEEVIRTRLQVYNTETSPVLGFYSRQGIVEEVHGVGEIGGVHELIYRAVQGVKAR